MNQAIPHNALRSDDLSWTNTSLPLWVRRTLVRADIETMISCSLHEPGEVADKHSFVDRALIEELLLD
jgi:hypothetical protein